MAREDSIRIRLDSDIKEEFKKIAEGNGITMSALAAYLIGNHVRQQTQFQNLMMQQLITIANDSASKQFEKVDMEKVMLGMVDLLQSQQRND